MVYSNLTKAEWLEKNGFSPEETTVIYCGNTYPVKDSIKAQGGVFNKLMGWHSAECIETLGEGVYSIVFEFDELYEWNENRGEAEFKIDAEALVKNAIKEILPKPTGGFIGELKERLRGIEVTLTDIYNNYGNYGAKTNFVFQTESGDILKWSTSTYREYTIGAKYLLTATVKSHYETPIGEKVTYVTRCEAKEM